MLQPPTSNMVDRSFDRNPQTRPLVLASKERIRWGQNGESKKNTTLAVPQADFFSGKLRPLAA